MSLAILGGGLAGLSAGHYILKSVKYDVTLIEKSTKLGGWIRSLQDPKTGVIFEEGPHTVRASGIFGRNTLSLIEDLQLESKIKAITSDHPAVKRRLIYVNRSLHYLPSEFSSLFKTISPFSRPLIFSVYNILFSTPKFCQDESIYDFTSRRFGTEIADYLISPMICGICAGDAKKISVKFLMPSLFEAEQKHGSILKGIWKENFFSKKNIKEEFCKLSEKAREEKWSVWNLEGGLSTLIKALETSFENKGGAIKLGSQVDKIVFEKNKAICKLEGSDLVTSHIVSAVPSYVLSQLVSEQHPKLAKELSDISFVSVAVVHLVYPTNVLEHNAFGFLVPPSENIPLLGVIFDSCIFPQNDKTVLTVMIGGSWFAQHLGTNPSNDTILKIALSEVNKILKISAEPETHHVSVLKNCIPQYVVGHRDRVDRISDYIKHNNLPLSIAGSSYNGVGVNDVIASGKHAVNYII